jgi:glycine dehydrogenase subunit 2
VRSRPLQGGADDPAFALELPSRSIGRVASHFGNFGMLLRAYGYLRLLGAEGLRDSAMHAVLNANYLRVHLRDCLAVPYDRTCMHELVCEGRVEGSPVRALDISKRLIDYGFHPPTNYFPLIVREALMIEPTETESKPTLDAFIGAMHAIVREARSAPELLRSTPHVTPTGRLDEVKAARQLVLVDACATGRAHA